MKKFIVLFMSVIIIFSMFSVYAENGDTTFTIKPKLNEDILELTVGYSHAFDMCGGSFNLTYNVSKLTLLTIDDNHEIGNTTHFVNEKFESDKIRVNWVSPTPMSSSGTLLIFKFKISNNMFDKNDVNVEKLKVANQYGEKINAKCELSDVITSVNDNSNASAEGYGYTSSGIVNNIGTDKNILNDLVTNTINFKDVSINDWFYDSIKFVFEKSLMQGVANSEFAPNDNITRGMFVTVLYRMEKEPASSEITFTDVEGDAYYAAAVSWANANNIVNGVNDTDFAPDDNISREQIGTILFRYVQYKGMDAITLEENLSQFADSEVISEYASSALNWAVGKGIIGGKGNGILDPSGNATRAEAAAMLCRLIGLNN